MNNIYSTNAFGSFCFVVARLPVYIPLALTYNQNKRILSDNGKIINTGRLSSKIPAEVRLYKKGWRPLV